MNERQAVLMTERGHGEFNLRENSPSTCSFTRYNVNSTNINGRSRTPLSVAIMQGRKGMEIISRVYIWIELEELGGLAWAQGSM